MARGKDIPQPLVRDEAEEAPETTIKVKSVKTDTIDVTTIAHHEGPILLPEGLTMDAAIAALQRRKQYDAYKDQDFVINAEWDCFIYEGAYALNKVLTEQFGWALAETAIIETIFGKVERPPVLLNVPIDEGVVEQVPWGRFAVPGIDGYIECSVAHLGGSGGMFGSPGKTVFRLTGKVTRKDEPKIKTLVEGITKRLTEHRIYRNKTFRLRLKDSDGDWLEEPEINFLPLNPAMETDLILSDEVRDSVTVNLFTPIERSDEARKYGVPLKRGVLLAGEYGTGKTMIAHVTAIKAKANGWTYIVAEGAHELADVIRLARQYEPCVVFHEDIDRTITGERDENMDHVLNVVDGVESKTAEVMLVLTTNDMASINPALLRPGRLDAVVIVAKPDAVAAEALARKYARGLIADDEPLTEAPAYLAGKISSVIREVIERSKLAALAATPPGQPIKITDAALVKAAKAMDAHIQAATPRPPDKRSERVKAADALAAAIREATPNHNHFGAAASIVVADEVWHNGDNPEYGSDYVETVEDRLDDMRPEVERSHDEYLLRKGQ